MDRNITKRFNKVQIRSFINSGLWSYLDPKYPLVIRKGLDTSASGEFSEKIIMEIQGILKSIRDTNLESGGRPRVTLKTKDYSEESLTFIASTKYRLNYNKDKSEVTIIW